MGARRFACSLFMHIIVKLVIVKEFANVPGSYVAYRFEEDTVESEAKISCSGADPPGLDPEDKPRPKAGPGGKLAPSQKSPDQVHADVANLFRMIQPFKDSPDFDTWLAKSWGEQRKYEIAQLTHAFQGDPSALDRFLLAFCPDLVCMMDFEKLLRTVWEKIEAQGVKSETPKQKKT
eukprot:TRINITY_DN17407_c0_g1_i1.p1 TRINITY_DN17407_c0_g1~~TRINITY_DN17407_c0_g1_i1.p1  ORF type:complete len:177 (+),score=21.97 TRINITY_DN17407_c0_g1_i1:68-598(+)